MSFPMLTAPSNRYPVNITNVNEEICPSGANQFSMAQLNSNFPKQAKPIMRTPNTASVNGGVHPSGVFCLVKCGVSLAKCAFSKNPVSCLISAGASDCITCL